METTTQTARCAFETRDDPAGEMIIAVHGQLVIDNAPDCLARISKILKERLPRQTVIDMEHVTRMDDYGAMVLAELKRRLIDSGSNPRITNTGEQYLELLEIVDTGTDRRSAMVRRKKKANIFIETGEITIYILKEIRFFIAFIGSTVLSCLHVVKSPMSLRFNDTIGFMKTTGVDALPVVGLISMLLGLILAFISSLQLRQYGATIYVATLVTTAMISELGPIMTAIIVAGRSGSAYAAEISTMKISEEIDALFVMGFDPNLFLVVPRLIAAVIVLPILAVFSNIFAIAGGTLIAVAAMNLTAHTYISQSIDAITLTDLSWGLFKSAVFAVMIAISGCLRGFQARGGAAAVGNAATSAVVTGIFLIILMDSIFAVIRSYWG